MVLVVVSSVIAFVASKRNKEGKESYKAAKNGNLQSNNISLRLLTLYDPLLFFKFVTVIANIAKNICCARSLIHLIWLNPLLQSLKVAQAFSCNFFPL